MTATGNSHKQVSRSAAKIWKDGFPAGNGRTGAIQYGGIRTERILINEESWYYRSRGDALPDMADCLEGVRSLLDGSRLEEANKLYEDRLREKGYDPHIGVFLPGFDLVVKRQLARPFSDYERSLDMSSGETSVEWTEEGGKIRRRMFVSRVNGLVLLEHIGDCSMGEDLHIRVQLHDFKDAIYQDGTRFFPELSEKVTVTGNKLLIEIRNTETGQCHYGVVRVEADGPDACIQARDGGLLAARARRVRVFIQPLPAGTEREAAERALGGLDQFPDDYEAHFEASKRLHAELYNRVSLTLPGDGEGASNESLLLSAHGGHLEPGFVEKLWNYGRYLLICSSSPGGLPAHLQGVWNGDYDPPWQCFYMANENIQMNYWQALPGNLPEMAEPLFSYYERLLPDFRTNAKQLFGCRGIYLPAATSPDSGLPKLLQAHIIYWISGAGWIAQHFFDYWRFTGDMDFLKNRALPFMQEVADFYEDYLIADTSGKFRVTPSISPENCPEDRIRPWAEGGPVFISQNATMDVAVCRELFQNLIEGAEIAGTCEDRLARWKGILGQLPPYQINNDGAIREWMHPDYPDNYNHRHLSHLYPVFPGNEISKKKDPELFEAFRKAVELRLDVGLYEQTGWSLAHMANIHARLGNGERALECLRLLAQVCLGQNLFSYHNDYRQSGITMDLIWGETAPFQIDANMGWTAAVMEMLVQSQPGYLKLLPALPESWRRGTLKNLLARGRVCVSVDWDLDKGRVGATLEPGVSGSIQVEVPEIDFPDKQVVGARVLSWNETGTIVDLEVTAGTRVEIHLG